MKSTWQNFLVLLLVFLGLTLFIPSLFKHQPFIMLPLLGILTILLMRQSLIAQEPPMS